MYHKSDFFCVNGGIFAAKKFASPYETKNPVQVEEIGSDFISYDMLAFDTQVRTISNKKMSGSYDNSIHMRSSGGLDYIRNICTWDIKKRLDINPVIHEADKNWFPMGSKEENTISITAEIEEDENLAGKWEFTLYKVINEKGYCLNFGEGEEYDLEFVDNQEGFIEMIFPRYFGHSVKTLLLTLVFYIPLDCNSQEMNVIFLCCKKFRCIRIFPFEPVFLFHKFSDKSIPLLGYDRNFP